MSEDADPAASPITEEEFESVAADLDRLNTLKLDKKRIEDEIDYLQAALSKEMGARAIREVEFYDHQGNPLKATVVAGVTRTFDLEALSAIDDDLAAAVSKRVADTDKLAKAEALGLLAKPEYQGLWKTKPRRPYILFTAPLEESNE